MKRIALCTLVATAVAVDCPAGVAETTWRVSAGPGFVIKRDYPGAKGEKVLAVPAIDIAYGRSWFLDSRRGAGAYIFNTDQRQLGASLSFRRGRDRRDAERISALPGIDDHAVARLFGVRGARD